jgi:predicted metal-dependent peptidase
LLDTHINGDFNDNPNAPVLSKEELQDIRNEIREAMIQAASADPGSTPNAISRMISDLTEAKLSWRDIVCMNIQSLVKTNYSYARPNRKGWAYNVVLPGLIQEETIEIAIALDMSGSICNDDARAFLSEVVGIVEQYQDFAIDIWCFDTDVYNHKRITQDNAYELLHYEPVGNGGTDFEVNWDWMKENDIQPKKFFMFTDGYPNGSWGDPDYCDTLFIVKGNQSATPPFGECVIYEAL